MCVSVVLASATQTSVETMYRDITSVDAVITMQMVCGECNSQNRYPTPYGRVTSLDAIRVMQATVGHITFDI